MKLKIDGVEIEVGSPAEAAELLARLREHTGRGLHLPPPAEKPARRGRPPKILQLVPPAAHLAPTSLASVSSASIDWFWHHRIPRAMLTVLYADPGVGKGTLVAMLAAAATTGGVLPEDDGLRLPAPVVYVVAEDNPALTLRPRLEAAGADVSLVQVFGPELRLRLPEHAGAIESAARAADADLIVVDPLRGIVDGDSRPKVRRALTALEDIAARTGAAVLVVHHTNRQGSLHGSQDILGIPRSVLRVDVGLRGVRSVEPTKKNLAPDVAPVYFTIASRGEVGAVEWVEAPEPETEESPAPDDAHLADQVLAELQLKVERPTLEGGLVWDAGAGEAALSLDGVAKRLEVTPRSLRVRMRRGTAAALVACSLLAGNQRYWTRSALEILIERGLEQVGRRTPGPPSGTGAKPEEEKMTEEFVRGLLLRSGGSVARAAVEISLSRAQLRRRVDELGLAAYAEQLREAAGSPRFAPAEPPATEPVPAPAQRAVTTHRGRRKPAIHKRCPCCQRARHVGMDTCLDCTYCKESGGSWSSGFSCPRERAKTLRPVTAEQVEAEHRAEAERRAERRAVVGDRAAHNHRPKTEPF